MNFAIMIIWKINSYIISFVLALQELLYNIYRILCNAHQRIPNTFLFVSGIAIYIGIDKKIFG